MARAVYDARAYGPDPIRECFWHETVELPGYPELEGNQTCDFAIIGAGFTGLNAAIELAGEDVVLLDANQPGWGASGRNGGFCCLGGAGLDHENLKRYHGEEEARLFAKAERAAVDHVSARLEAGGIDADCHSDGETLLAHSAHAFAKFAEAAESSHRLYGTTPTILPREALAQAGLKAEGLHGATTMPIGFALNPAKYVAGLARMAGRGGARIHGNTSVTKVKHDGDFWQLTTPHGRVLARRILFATNGYMLDGLPAALTARFLPIQSNILVTRPLTDDELQAQGWTSRQMCYDSRNLLHYFRLLPDNRMLFGLRGDTSGGARSFERMRRVARRDFDRMFPAWHEVETPYFWSGLLALTGKLSPFIGELPDMPNAFAACGYHGNGVGMGSYAGSLVAQQMYGRADPRPAPQFMRILPRRFPLGRHRRLMLPLAYHAYALKDRFS